MLSAVITAFVQPYKLQWIAVLDVAGQLVITLVSARSVNSNLATKTLVALIVQCVLIGLVWCNRSENASDDDGQTTAAAGSVVVFLVVGFGILIFMVVAFLSIQALAPLKKICSRLCCCCCSRKQGRESGDVSETEQTAEDDGHDLEEARNSLVQPRQHTSEETDGIELSDLDTTRRGELCAGIGMGVHSIDDHSNVPTPNDGKPNGEHALDEGDLLVPPDDSESEDTNSSSSSDQPMAAFPNITHVEREEEQKWQLY
jgi:hypothetical protein